MKYAATLTVILTLVSGPSLAQAASHTHSDMPQHQSSSVVTPAEPGQSAFASVQEIVELLLEDPNTDWARVDLEALRSHLADMDNVTLRSNVEMDRLASGARFTVTSQQEYVSQSIKNMVLAHGLEMSGTYGWMLSAEEAPQGAVLSVTGMPEDTNKIQGLGFIGIMTLGMHHQSHHIAIARGENPH
ncbi:hypothetical protein LP7551_04692 [Roseibium album]|nr:hypothetical protein LP7551_04692 [Roseibium album]